MNAAFLRREWGATSFVLTVLIGAVVVPVALYLGNRAAPPAAQGAAHATPAPAVSVSAAPSPSPAPSHPASASPHP